MVYEKFDQVQILFFIAKQNILHISDLLNSLS